NAPGKGRHRTLEWCVTTSLRRCVAINSARVAALVPRIATRQARVSLCRLMPKWSAGPLGLTGCQKSHRLIGCEGEGMITRTDSVGLVLGSLLMTLGCSTAPTPTTNPDAVRQHADKAFQQLQAQEPSQPPGDLQSSTQASTPGDTTAMPAPSLQKGVQIPFAEIGPSDGEYIRATGYGNLAKGLYLCQHSADLAARVELSKL